MLADALDSAARVRDASLAASLDMSLKDSTAGAFVDWTAYEVLSPADGSGGQSATDASNLVNARMLIKFTISPSAASFNYAESSGFQSDLVDVLKAQMSRQVTKMAMFVGLVMPNPYVRVEGVTCDSCRDEFYSLRRLGLRRVLDHMDDPEVKVLTDWSYSSPMGISLMESMGAISNMYSNILGDDPFSERYSIKSTYMYAPQEITSFPAEGYAGEEDGFPLWALGIIIPGAIILLLLGFWLCRRGQTPVKVQKAAVKVQMAAVKV